MSQDKFLEIFNSASETISKNFLAGTIPFLANHLPALLKQIDSAEDDINDKWAKDLSSFEESVKKWKELWLKGIFKFRQVGTLSEKKESVSSEAISQKVKQPANIFDIIRNT